MLYDLSNPLHIESFRTKCENLLRRGGIVDLTEKKQQRSLRQNAYLHAALGYFGLQTGFKLDEVKQWFFKQECNPDLFIQRKSDKLTGKERIALRSSAELDTAELTLAIDRFRDWAAQVADIYIPSPEDHRMVMQMEMDVQRAKYYL